MKFEIEGTDEQYNCMYLQNIQCVEYYYSIYSTCTGFYTICRVQGLADGVVMDVKLHEQPTGLNPVQRTSLYAKKLTWYSKGKTLHSFTPSAGAAFTRPRLGSGKKKRQDMYITYLYVHVCILACIGMNITTQIVALKLS